MTTTMDPVARWLFRPTPARTATVRLFCLPHAGGGAATFAGWSEALGPDVDVVGIRLPGREGRFAEPRYRRMAPLLHDLAAVLPPFLDLPVAWYGHSAGAIVAYALALTMPRPRALIVAGNRPPGDRARFLHRLSDTDLLRRLDIPASAGPAQLTELMLPTIRDDIELAETFHPAPPATVPCPLLALAGRDDPDAPARTMAGWARVAAGRFTLGELPGGHFFVRSARHRLFDDLRAALSGGVCHGA